MKLQKLYTLIPSILLVTTISAYGMEQSFDPELALQTSEYNCSHPLICLPLEIQQQITFPCGITVPQITEDNADELQEQIKTFFRLKEACKYFNEKLQFPWINLNLETKNKMLQEVNVLMTNLSLAECSTVKPAHVWSCKYPRKVSFGYEKYCTIPLALICSGADADITHRTASTTCLSKAVHAQDVFGVALLLEHGADPYQIAFDEHALMSAMLESTYQISYDDAKIPVCFLSPTVAIVKLFLARIDQKVLLDMPVSQCIAFFLARDFCSSKVLKMWLDYGLNAYNERDVDSFIFLIRNFYKGGDYSIDVFLEKLELLLKADPRNVNMKNQNGETPIDAAQSNCAMFGAYICKKEDHERIIALLIKYGGKTVRELEAEKLTTEQKVS